MEYFFTQIMEAELNDATHSKKRLSLPTSSIQNIKCIATIGTKDNRKSIDIAIKTGDTYLYYDIVKSNIQDFTVMMLLLKKITFDKFTGRFHHPLNKCGFSKPVVSAFPELECDSIKMDYEKCCVCMENTLTTTHCRHFLCYECKSSLKVHKCPLCRKHLGCDCGCGSIDSDSDSD